MRKKYILISLTILTFLNCDFNHSSLASVISGRNIEKYPGIVLGRILEKKIVKSGVYYLTEYKLKVKEWLYTKDNIEKVEYITIKILGAEFPEKGIVMRASTAPRYIPIKKEALFFLEYNKVRKKNIYTLSNDGVIYGKKDYRTEINEIKSIKRKKIK